MNKKLEENVKNYGSLDGTGATQKNNSPKDEIKSRSTEDIPSFAEVWTEKEFEDTELLTNYLNTELVINKFEMGEGKYGPYVILNASVNGVTKLLRTSSTVVVDQLARIEDKLPVKATVVEKGGANGKKYLSLS